MSTQPEKSSATVCDFLRIVGRTTLRTVGFCVARLHFIFALLRSSVPSFRMKGTLLAPFEINWASTKDGPGVRNLNMFSWKFLLKFDKFE